MEINEKDKKLKPKKPINFSLNFSEDMLKIPFFENKKFEKKIDRDIEQRLIIKININENENYIGETIENIPDGFGIIKTKNYIYKGLFKEGKKNGPGILNYNKETYNLFFEDDKLLNNYCIKIEHKYIIEGGIKESKINKKLHFKDIAIVTNIHKKEKMECEIKNKEIIFVKKYNIEKPNSYIYGPCNKFGKPFNDTIMEVDKNSYLIILNYINGKQEGYFEKYNINGKYTFGNIHQGKISGYEFNLDNKFKSFSFGKFVNGIKDGPFQFFSNYKNNKDLMVLTQIYLCGFLSKNVDKYENGSKYILQNYPEYANFLKIPYMKIVNILEKYIGENKYEQYLNKFEGKKKEKKESKKHHKEKLKSNNNNNSNHNNNLNHNNNSNNSNNSNINNSNINNKPVIKEKK